MSAVVSSHASSPRFLAPVDRTPPISARERWDPRHDRRSVNIRWLVATSLIAIASASLLLGVLHAALRGTAKAYAPTIAVSADAQLAPGEGLGRGNRLSTAAAPAPTSRNVQVHVEQVRSSGSAVVPFTYLVAHLGKNAPTEVGAPGPKPATPMAALPEPSAPSLPPEILMGGLARTTPVGVSAYAAKARFDLDTGPRGTPLNVTTIVGTRHLPDDPDRVILAQRGDRIEPMLLLLGLSQTDAADIATAVAPPGLSRMVLVGGETIVIRQNAATAQPSSARPVTIRIERTDGSVGEAALSDAGHYERVAVPIQAAPGIRSVAFKTDPQAADDDGADQGSVRDSLYALSRHNIADQPLVDELVRLSSAYTDLGVPVSSDDTAEFLYSVDKPDPDTDPVLDFTGLTIDGETHRFYRFETSDDGSVDYYDRDGHSVTKFLLRKPVANGRLGDGFGWRTHPILGDRRFHQGVDYAAPYGSPVVAAGAGVVEKIDYEGGYGKYIRVRHDLGYETTYSHVSGYPRGIRVGTRVRQGETIAYIGSTGLSTGPHLYYEVKINDHNVDPLRIKLSAGRILEGEALATFARRRDRIDVLIKASTVGTASKKS
ncbi:M23 family metallopeptidase [Lichenihabitans psoromatis]|uniref:M23 family metallopeptidase n=1 Tax=Lichenihabitans psoromatis TaxID=2528642 RepID=UPI001036838B|nr:M23 family metallopeptidase [Lichenihabitans psoromatis]